MKIVGIFMIKNEERIILRMLQSVKDICDAISITDTGSTDNTIKVLQNSTIKKDIYETKFTNFGESRTISFKNALETARKNNFDLAKTYGLLLDADMILNIENKDIFLETLATNVTSCKSYSIEQRNGYLRYYNTRLIRMDCDWKCIGPTHEYWSCTDYASYNLDCAFIDDVSDGGCKSDKTTRDIRLLKEAEENDRNTFYLAQSYNDLGDYNNAVRCYLKRIDFGGWQEEVFYSYYQLAKIYAKQKKYDKMEIAALQAHFCNRNRREPLILLLRELRNINCHERAQNYLLMAEKLNEPKNVLFSDSSLYDKEVIDFEKTILSYYLNDEKGLKLSWRYLHDYPRDKNFDIVHKNLSFYVKKIKHEKIKLMFEKLGSFKASSCCIIRYKKVLIGNARYINYDLYENGDYQVNGDKVRTKNYFFVMNDDYEKVSMQFLEFKDSRKVPNYIEGLEDIRVYEEENKLKFYANTLDFTPHVTVVAGSYFPLCTAVEKIYNTGKNEKNWFPFEGKFLTGPWELPNATPFFSHLRGSSSPVKYNNCTYILLHDVIMQYSGKRKYFYVLAKVEEGSTKLSLPFKLSDYDVEYSLSFLIEKGHFYFSCSEKDDDPFVAKVPIDDIEKMFDY